MEAYRLIGVGSFITMSAALMFLVVRWPLGTNKTFSQHAAQSKRLSIYYFSIFATTMPLLWLFITFYLTPRFLLPTSVSILFGLTTVSQIICTLFPEKGGTLLLHRIFAGTSALLMLPTIYIVSEKIGNDAPSSIGWTGFAIMTLAIIFATHFRKRFSLMAQIVYYAAFFIALFVVSFMA